MKRIKHLLTLLLILSTSYVSAQLEYEERIELETKDGYSGEQILEFGKEGFIISSISDKSTDKESEWRFQKYDVDLKLVQTESTNLSSKLSFNESYIDEERIYYFLTEKNGSFTIITIEAKDLSITKTEGIMPKKTYVSNMAVLDDMAVFTAKTKKESFLLTVNWKTGKKKVLPISINNFKSKRLSVSNFQTLKKEKEILVYVKAYKDKKSFDTYIIQLNEEGEKESVYNLTKNIKENIIDISTSKLAENKYVFTGTYSQSFSIYSEGIFFCEAENEKINFINFTPFLDLNNFPSYLPKKKQEKIEKKKARKKKKGKEYKINYRIAAHGIITVDDGYLFLGEAYYPTYRTENYTTTTTVNGVTTTQTQTRQVFDGYQYTHAVLSKFDNKGKLLWDQIFEMNPSYKPFFEKRFISIAERNQNSINLVFANRNKINSKSFSFDGTILKDSESDEIKTDFEDDKVKRSFSNIDYWYDRYFIAYGSQVIKNTEKKNGKKKRKVFFINKIKFQ